MYFIHGVSRHKDMIINFKDKQKDKQKEIIKSIKPNKQKEVIKKKCSELLYQPNAFLFNLIL